MGEIDLLARGRPVRLPWDRSWTLTLRQLAPLFITIFMEPSRVVCANAHAMPY